MAPFPQERRGQGEGIEGDSMKRKMVIVFCILFLLCIAQSPAQRSTPIVEYLKADTTSKFPFSDAVKVGPMLYLSGQIGLDSTGRLVPGGIGEETRQVMENIRKILERNGSNMANIVKCTVMLADIKEWPAFNALYRTYFDKHHLPVRSAFGANGLAMGARVEVECWAVIK